VKVEVRRETSSGRNVGTCERGKQRGEGKGRKKGQTVLKGKGKRDKEEVIGKFLR